MESISDILHCGWSCLFCTVVLKIINPWFICWCYVSPFIYDIQISSARKTGTFTGRPIGKVPLIEASQTALNLVATTVLRISTGSGDILPKTQF